MANSGAMYFKVPEDSVDAPRSTSSRGFKVVIALIGGSCLLLLGVAAASAWGPMLGGAGAPRSLPTTSLLGLSTSLRSAKAPSSMLPPQVAGNLPGPSPWKELALAGLEASNMKSRDISMRANPINSVMANMNSASRTLVARAQKSVISKMQELEAGQLAPTGFWDPVGFSTSLDPGKILFYREAELKHGRVSMLAALGFLVGEQFHPLFGGDIDVPSYIAFQAIPLRAFWTAVAVVIAIPESFSINTLQSPVDDKGQYQDQNTFSANVNLDRIPGDIGFDPLGLKPKDPDALLEMQNKELNNGRLAMIGIAGMVAQELVTGKKLF